MWRWTCGRAAGRSPSPSTESPMGRPSPSRFGFGFLPTGRPRPHVRPESPSTSQTPVCVSVTIQCSQSRRRVQSLFPGAPRQLSCGSGNENFGHSGPIGIQTHPLIQRGDVEPSLCTVRSVRRVPSSSIIASLSTTEGVWSPGGVPPPPPPICVGNAPRAH